MRIKIYGELTASVLAQAFVKALDEAGYDEETHVIKGANIYFNLYDIETGEKVETDCEEVEFQSPVEQENRLLLKKLKADLDDSWPNDYDSYRGYTDIKQS